MGSIFPRRKIFLELRNFSRFSPEIVWENAQDLEHVAFLHRQTNKNFLLLYAHRNPGSVYAYDFLSFRAERRLLKIIPISTIGSRRIVGNGNLHQWEEVPILGLRTFLDSRVEPAPAASGFASVLVDQVTMEVPFFLSFLEGFIGRALARHTRIQCQEDEAFRARRVELRERGIQLPFTLFREPLWGEPPGELTAGS